MIVGTHLTQILLDFYFVIVELFSCVVFVYFCSYVSSTTVQFCKYSDSFEVLKRLFVISFRSKLFILIYPVSTWTNY